MKPIPITKYLTINATQAAKELAAEYQLYPVTYEDLYAALNSIFKKFPEDAYKDFGKIHPDRQMIIDSIQNNYTEGKSTQVFSHADGQNFECKEKKSGTDGVTTDNTGAATTTPPAITPLPATFNFDMKKNMPYIIGGAVVITGLIILIKHI